MRSRAHLAFGGPVAVRSSVAWDGAATAYIHTVTIWNVVGPPCYCASNVLGLLNYVQCDVVGLVEVNNVCGLVSESRVFDGDGGDLSWRQAVFLQVLLNLFNRVRV